MQRHRDAGPIARLERLRKERGGSGQNPCRGGMVVRFQRAAAKCQEQTLEGAAQKKPAKRGSGLPVLRPLVAANPVGEDIALDRHHQIGEIGIRKRFDFFQQLASRTALPCIGFGSFFGTFFRVRNRTAFADAQGNLAADDMIFEIFVWSRPELCRQRQIENILLWIFDADRLLPTGDPDTADCNGKAVRVLDSFLFLPDEGKAAPVRHKCPTELTVNDQIEVNTPGRTFGVDEPPF